MVERSLPRLAHYLTVGLCLVIVLGLLFVLVHVLGNANIYLQSWPRVLLHVALPATAGGFLIALCLAPMATRAMGLAIMFSAGIAVLAVEVNLQYQSNRQGSGISSEVLKSIAETRESLESKGRRALPIVCPAMLLARGTQALDIGDGQSLFPLGGLRNNTLVSFVEDEIDLRVTDRFGFQNPDSVWDQPADIVIVGDSYATGAGVKAGYGFTDRIRAAFPATVNVGCGGNGPLIELATLAEYGMRTNPHLILWFFFDNDIPKNIRKEQESSILMSYLDGTTQSLASNQEALDNALLAYLKQLPTSKPTSADSSSFWREMSLKRVFKLVYLRTALVSSFGPFETIDLVLFGKVLGKASELAKESGAKLFFVPLPGQTRYLNPLARAGHMGASAQLLTVVGSLGIPIIKITDAFDAHSNPESLFYGHYTEEGYALVSKTVLDHIGSLLD